MQSEAQDLVITVSHTLYTTGHTISRLSDVGVAHYLTLNSLSRLSSHVTSLIT